MGDETFRHNRPKKPIGYIGYEEGEMIWYRVSSWSDEIEELEVKEATPAMLILEGKDYKGKHERVRKETRDIKCFRHKKIAINFKRELLKTKIESAKMRIKHCEQDLEEFDAKYKDNK